LRVYMPQRPTPRQTPRKRRRGDHLDADRLSYISSDVSGSQVSLTSDCSTPVRSRHATPQGRRVRRAAQLTPIHLPSCVATPPPASMPTSPPPPYEGLAARAETQLGPITITIENLSQETSVESCCDCPGACGCVSADAELTSRVLHLDARSACSTISEGCGEEDANPSGDEELHETMNFGVSVAIGNVMRSPSLSDAPYKKAGAKVPHHRSIDSLVKPAKKIHRMCSV